MFLSSVALIFNGWKSFRDKSQGGGYLYLMRASAIVVSRKSYFWLIKYLGGCMPVSIARVLIVDPVDVRALSIDRGLGNMGFTVLQGSVLLKRA